MSQRNVGDSGRVVYQILPFLSEIIFTSRNTINYFVLLYYITSSDGFNEEDKKNHIFNQGKMTEVGGRLIQTHL